jgi:hypothetical protein
LIQSESWKIIKQHLENEIYNHEQRILNNFEKDRNKPEYSINDLEKIQLLVYKNILKKPQDILDEIELVGIIS